MGGATKILTLLSTPLPLLHSRPVTLNLSRYTQLALTSLHSHHQRRSLSSLPPRAGNSRIRLHTHAAAFRGDSPGSPSFEDSASKTASGSDVVRISWPEWGRFVDYVSGVLRGGGGRGGVDAGDDSFSGFEKLPAEFVAAAEICLGFARQRPELLRLLSKKDVDLVVENGSPFLFKHALNSSRRMRAFVNGDDGSVSDHETERAETVDLMRYLLGHVYNNLFSPRQYSSATKFVEESVRNLFNQLVNPTETIHPPNFTESYNQSSTGFEQSSLRFRQDIEMKRGDWICSKCKFMNFAKNARCLECQVARPKRQLTGGEWECPQCDFFNYGRNMACLKCDCKRPPSPNIGEIYAKSNETKSEIERKLAENDEKSERWFNKASQISDNDMSNLNNVINDEDFPEIMPLREGVNRHVVSNRKMSLERLTDDQYTRNTGDNDGGRIEGTESAISKTLDRILGQQSSLDTKRKVSSQPGRSDPHSLPFVPLPADMFRKSQTDDRQPQPSGTPNSSLQSDKWGNGSSSGISESGKSIDSLTGAAEDEEFPDIMPMRKGENRFVVSKKKDRSLTSSSSPQYKKRLAMDQSSTSNFVPFVPFPPDYFAKKNDKPTSKSESEMPENSSEIKSDANNVAPKINSPSSMSGSSSWNSGSSFPENSSNNTSQAGNPNPPPPWNNNIGNYVGSGPSPANSSAPSSWNDNIDVPRNDSARASNSHSTYVNHSSSSSSSASSFNYNRANQSGQSTEKTVSSGGGGDFTGKSLEGSAVADPDPLDMSEEAKAQRWFRRVAQIKDISELSNIPDEDFPEIMPMRKGVNRFVVSKRKTPLERRLTSPQYRRNLPIVSSDHENDGSNKHGSA